MRRGQKSQSRTRHQRAVGRYHSPYQRGGTIAAPPITPWTITSYSPFQLDPRPRFRRPTQKGAGHKVVYPWKSKGWKRIKRRRRRR